MFSCLVRQAIIYQNWLVDFLSFLLHRALGVVIPPEIDGDQK